MPFCKICTCGEKIVFERRLSFPDNCPSCGRKLVDFITYNEDDPRVEELIQKAASTKSQASLSESPMLNNEPENKKYALILANGTRISIPEGGCIIGRTETGAEELAEYPSVSRQHLRIIIKKNIGVMIEDLSSYGTLVNGKRIQKNTPVMVDDGSTITLCDTETTLSSKETDEQ